MMLRPSLVLLRRGKPRPRAGMFPDKYRRVPQSLKPQQGGQQFFSDFLLRAANEELMRSGGGGAAGGVVAGEFAGARSSSGRGDPDATSFSLDDSAQEGSGLHPLLPQMDLDERMAASREEQIQKEMQALIAQDSFQHSRGFNERAWYEQERERMAHAQSTVPPPSSRTEETLKGGGAGLPERVLGADYFESRYGYSLMKHGGDRARHDGSADATSPAAFTAYSELDLWGEMPKYRRDMVFLYLVARRRNTYAVAYDYDGKRLLPTYTAGNRGLKGGDRGFRADGSTDNGHQVTSMYLNDLIPKIRELRALAGRPLAKGEKVQLVVRVMGFYNGRQGAVRAVQDRADEFTVRYLEDITPFPLNGPKMPRGVFR